MNASTANTQAQSSGPSAIADWWGPPADPNFRAARAMFQSIVLPVLASENPPFAAFHRHINKNHPIPGPIVAEYLDQLKALGQERPSFAWAAANVALDSAVINNHVGVVRALLSVPNWRVSVGQDAPFHAFRCDEHPDLLQLLVSDERFDNPSLWYFISPPLAVDDRQMEQVKARIHRLLSSGRFPPKLAWGHMMHFAMAVDYQKWGAERHFQRAFRLPSVMDMGQWQFSRFRNQNFVLPSPQDKPWPIPPRLSLSPTCPKLLVGLPLDIQLILNDMLDISTAHSLRLTCRSLQHFPMDRFAQLPVVRELHHMLTSMPKSTANSPSQYDSARIRNTINSVPGRAGPSTMDYRVLVEAVRHLDVELALKFLCPRPEDAAAGYDLLRARDPKSTGYVVSWALFVLLKALSKPASDHGLAQLAKGGLLLQALLLHPLLDKNAWSLLLEYFDLCHDLLVAAALDADAITAARVRHHGSVKRATAATVTFIIHLIRTGTFLEPVPTPILSDLNPSNSSSVTRIVVLLATLSCNPSTFANLLRVLPSPLNSDFHLLIRSVACSRPDPSGTFIPLVLSRLPRPTETDLRNLIVGPLGGGIGYERALDHIAAYFTKPRALWDLLEPRDTLSARQAPANAVLLMHWLRLAPSTVSFRPWETFGSKEYVAPADRFMLWSEAGRCIEACLPVLEKAKQDGDQVAGEWHDKLSAAWEPWRSFFRPRPGLADRARSGCLVQ